MAPKIAVITGTSRGLGRSAAEHLIDAGVGVIGTYRHGRDGAEQVADRARAAGLPGAALELDVSDRSTFAGFVDSVRGTLTENGRERVDFLVNNAGIGTFASFADTTQEQFDELVRVHLKAPFFLTQAMLPLIADGGRILNVSSGLARFTGPGYAAYAAMKGGVEVLTRYQAKELGARQIRVNVVVPGAIATDFGGGAVRDNEEIHRAVSQQVALGRPGEADEIGSAVAAILSDGFGWADGSRIELSGGQNL